MMADGNISFSHVGRMGNMIAHHLAQPARYVRSFWIWTEDVPHILFMYFMPTVVDLILF